MYVPKLGLYSAMALRIASELAEFYCFPVTLGARARSRLPHFFNSFCNEPPPENKLGTITSKFVCTGTSKLVYKYLHIQILV